MPICGCLCIRILISVFGEQWVTALSTPDRGFCSTYTSLHTVMAERSRIRALQRIVDTSRKFGLTCTNTTPRATQTASPTPNTPTVLESLPEHKPLLPILLSHNIPSKLAKACADRYDSYAKQLRSAAETKFAPYLLNRRSHAPSVYYFFLESYNQTLRRWAQSVLTAALKRLKRDSVDLQNLDVTYPNPLWFPVRLLILKFLGRR